MHAASRSPRGDEPALAPSGLQAPVLEVFASFQGEGQYVGEPQSFVRLAGCPLRCRWCDTPGSWAIGAADATARIDARNARRREQRWATPFQVACWVAQVEPGAPRTISVTGGEPLLWPEFVRALAKFAGPRRVHLETAGAHPRALAHVLDSVQHVSLDLKLPADLDAPVEFAQPQLAAGGAPWLEASPSDAREWAEARAECLSLVRGRDACAKLLVAGGRRASEFDPLLESVAEHAPELPLFLQPVTPVRDVPAPDFELLTQVAERARDLELRVRLVPQTHKALGLP